VKKYFIITILIILNYFTVEAQYFSNPSFESDVTGMDRVPEEWSACNSNSTPDIQPGALNVEKTASFGATYLGLILLDPTDGDGPKNEGVSTKLLKPLYKDSLYILSIDLADIPDAYEGGNSPQQLRISGGTFSCAQTDVLIISDTIKNTRWVQYDYVFTPFLDSITYIKLEIFGDKLNSRGYMVLDNISIKNYQQTGMKNICQGQ
jgi:hypothetical protein